MLISTGDTIKPGDNRFTVIYWQTRLETGLTASRTALYWRTVEPHVPVLKDGIKIHTYNWTHADRLFRTYFDSGVQPVPIMGGVPAWSRPSGRIPQLGPDPEYLHDWELFAEALARRYSGDGSYHNAPGNPKVEVFQIFNEVDIMSAAGKSEGDAIFGGVPNGGYLYKELCRYFHRGMKRGNPNAVLIPSLAGEEWRDSPFNFKREGGDFLDDFLRAGGGKYIDGMSFHYYKGFEQAWGDITGKAHYFNNRLKKFGLDAKPIYVTEVGWSTADQLPRARWLAKTFVQAAHSGLFELLSWFRYQAEGELAGHGLVIGNIITPAYHAFRVVAEELRGAVPLERPVPEIFKDGLWFGRNLEVYPFLKPGGARLYVYWRKDLSTKPEVAGLPSIAIFPGDDIRVREAARPEPLIIQDEKKGDVGAGSKRQIVPETVPEDVMFVEVGL